MYRNEQCNKPIIGYVSSPNISSCSSTTDATVSADTITQSSVSPLSPIINVNNFVNINKYIYDETRCMISKGYYIRRKLAKTLQGNIWTGVSLNNGNFNNNIVIKVTNKQLHNNNMTVLDGGVKVAIEENIISEMKILKHLTNSDKNNKNSGISKYICNFVDFFIDENNYFLVMEHGGSSVFDFVLKAHNCIVGEKLIISEWHSVCKILFKQMISFLDILHNKLNIAHLDISLENMLINDVLINVDTTQNNMIHFIPQFNIKFCDFGLSTVFDPAKNASFTCNKFVGKTNYKSPEIYNKTFNFSAKASDIWSIGVCLFALLIGSMPFNKPSPNDPTFQWIISGHIEQLVTREWGKHKYINENSLDCMFKIFKYEKERIQMNQLLKHPYLL